MLISSEGRGGLQPVYRSYEMPLRFLEPAHPKNTGGADRRAASQTYKAFGVDTRGWGRNWRATQLLANALVRVRFGRGKLSGCPLPSAILSPEISTTLAVPHRGRTTHDHFDPVLPERACGRRAG